MVWFGIIGIGALILSLFHFFRPSTILKADEFGRKVVVLMADIVRKYPKMMGLFYLICAVLLIYVGFFWKVK